jgi:predicted Zn-dependent protease with MMP-like domain
MHRLIKGLIMNQRIKQLAEQVGAVQNVLAMGRHDGVLFTETELDRFAELIVRECADLTRWQEYDMSVEQRIRLGIYQEIKQHFGVEE